VPSAEATALLREVGKRLAAARRARKLTQEQLAEQLEISPGYLQRVEAGHENLTVETITKLATAVGLSAWKLLETPK
jgi:HTH-type transcriptional regulator / antitoxin HipB